MYTKFGCPWRNTKYSLNFHPPACNLALYQKSTHYMDPKVFSSLPTYIQDRQHDVNELK